MVNPLRLLEMSLLIGLLNFLRENNKVHSDDAVLKEELVKYVRLNKKKTKEFKNRLTALREISEYKNKIQDTRDLNFKKEEH